jgi:hypothetical protein
MTSSGSILYNSNESIAGFQFNIDCATISDASGGDAALEGLTASSSSSTVLGFSFNADVIPAGCGTLTNLTLDRDTGTLSDITISGVGGITLNFDSYRNIKSCDCEGKEEDCNGVCGGNASPSSQCPDGCTVCNDAECIEYCGNGTCDEGETVDACPIDCGCGNGECDESENTDSCPDDCYCGNGTCDEGETVDACRDCILGCESCNQTYNPIIDQIACCDHGWEEFEYTCLYLDQMFGFDCSGCECPGDGDAACGDGLCNGSETYSDCPADCTENGCNTSNQVDDCADEDCWGSSWVGDGYCDGADQAYGADLSCYDCDGGDCIDECGVCDGSGIADGDCDCDGNTDDCCGECGGDNSSCGGSGDIDGGGISVTDIVAMVGAILGDGLDECAANEADINGDGQVSVLDVIAAVDAILSGQIGGCTDEAADNYNADADYDDGSCT